MALSYKLVKRKNPQEPEAAKKWYATPNSAKPLSERELVKAAIKNTTLSPAEMRTSLDAVAEYVPQQLRQGHTVKLPGFGTFRLSFNSKGSDTVDDFDPQQMIRNPRIIFTPDAAFRDSVLHNLEFADGGVLEDGVNYATRADYKNAKAPAGSGEAAGE